MRLRCGKLQLRGVAGVCIEDKLFPKTNSFLNGTSHPLADVDEFCGKIKAARIRSSVPTLSSSPGSKPWWLAWGSPKRLRRADAYRQAGADAILIHSTRTVPDEIRPSCGNGEIATR